MRWQTRKKLSLVVGNKCVDKGNIEILKEILNLRNEAAKRLGYQSDAQFMLEIKIAKTPENVEKFLKETSELLEPIFNSEFQDLLFYKEKHLNSRNEPFDSKINSFDVTFYQKLRLKEKFDIDDEVVREYFPVDVVIDGVLSVYESVFSLLFSRDKEASVWHPEVYVNQFIFIFYFLFFIFFIFFYFLFFFIFFSYFFIFYFIFIFILFYFSYLFSFFSASKFLIRKPRNFMVTFILICFQGQGNIVMQHVGQYKRDK